MGYYCAGMNKHATVRVHGNAGTGSRGEHDVRHVVVDGNASQSAGATAHGGLLVVHGDAAARCGISMKGVDIVVGGSVGHLSAFMAQTGCLVVCGDAGDALGDSIYEARSTSAARSRGSAPTASRRRCAPSTSSRLRGLLDRAGSTRDPRAFRRYGSARRLYNFHVDNAGIRMAPWHLRESALYDRT